MPFKPETPKSAASFTGNYLLFLLAQVSAIASTAFHAELARDGVSLSTWRITSSLYPDTRLNVGALAQHCLLKQPTLTRALDRLERDGLVHRLHSTKDRRGVLVELTKSGRKLAAQNIKLAKQHEATLLAEYSAEQTDALKTALQNLLQHLKQP